ncbi:MAG: tetratricopeptide repeat protein [Deferribacteraceae bacterium]|jgi:uncharacterized protein YfaP (DUF2135 family)|nr:tetratricopeptide repeat protein [Deferribacteraceae bacterium]
MKKLVFLCLLLLSLPAFAANVDLLILDATVKDKTVPNAEVVFQKQGQSSVSAKTGTDGKLSIAAPFGADDSSVLMIIRKDGYSPLTVQCPCDDLVYAISPVMQALDGIRVVLSWNREPEDVDAHLIIEDQEHIYWGEQNTKSSLNDAELDVDDTDSYGPETITINKRRNGLRYIYAVHNYSAYDAGKTDTNTDLSNLSQAKVFVYIGSSLIKSYQVPRSAPGMTWLPFYIDSYGNIVDVNAFVSNFTTTDEYITSRLIAAVEGNSVAYRPSTQNIATSTTLNADGETAYHNKDYQTAVALYLQAIELDPNNGQAYSNLGLAYQRMNNFSEALWANRKAIDLASGSNKNTIQASSYYNIARIYEAQGQWQDALEHFELALSKRDNKAYTDGIARMKAKL